MAVTPEKLPTGRVDPKAIDNVAGQRGQTSNALDVIPLRHELTRGAQALSAVRAPASIYAPGFSNQSMIRIKSPAHEAPLNG